jgi:peptide deformylase
MTQMSKDIFKILTHRSKILHQAATETLTFPLSLRNEDLIYKTIDTLRYNEGVYAKRGLAISANQIGSLKRFFVICDLDVNPLGRRVNVICNPEILETDNEVEEMFEGCLSIPKYQCLVSRPKKCIVQYQDLNGKTEKKQVTDFLARVFMHELDHLNGVIMLDKQLKIVENPLYRPYLEKLGQKRATDKKQKTLLNQEQPDLQL